MSGTLVHLAVADRLYDMLGSGIVKNLPFFFGGNLAPDAVHARRHYQRADKKHTHLCDGIRSYGYGYPETSKLFKDRVDEFIKNYYFSANEDKDLYLGYVAHLLLDEFDMFSAYEALENKRRSEGIDTSAPGFQKSLADEGNNGDHREFFISYTNFNDISTNQYIFIQNAVDVLEAVWDYEVKEYISANEINTSKRWVINKYFGSECSRDNILTDESKKSLQFIDLAAKNIFKQIQNIV